MRCATATTTLPGSKPRFPGSRRRCRSLFWLTAGSSRRVGDALAGLKKCSATGSLRVCEKIPATGSLTVAALPGYSVLAVVY
jgi:hypothetical protein